MCTKWTLTVDYLDWLKDACIVKKEGKITKRKSKNVENIEKHKALR